MFDKDLFDRSVYDRSVASDGISVELQSSSQLKLQLTVTQPILFSAMLSQGTLKPELLFITPIECGMESSGTLNSSSVVLQQPLDISFIGSGTSLLNPTVTMPLDSIAIAGSGNIHDTNTFLYLHVGSRISANGDLGIMPNIRQILDANLSGSCELGLKTILFKLELSVDLQGDGDLILRHVGSLNEDLFQLININLQPGQEVTIDTDLLDVFFGYLSDVSSVTTDSVFFDLNPGENEITISTDTQNTLQVTAIWQNRWL